MGRLKEWLSQKREEMAVNRDIRRVERQREHEVERGEYAKGRAEALKQQARQAGRASARPWGEKFADAFGGAPAPRRRSYARPRTRRRRAAPRRRRAPRAPPGIWDWPF